MKQTILFFKEHALFLLGSVVLFFSLVIFSTTIRGEELTSHFFDPSRITKDRPEIVIVGIDDVSLQSLGAWPWDRSIFAKLTTTLSSLGAKAIVYDVLFLEKRSGDEAFKQAIHSSPIPIIFASKEVGNQYLESYLTLESNRIMSGLANVVPDSDGKVRKYPASRVTTECIDALGYTAFKLYTNKINTCIDLSTYSFRYLSNEKTISVSSVLTKQIPESSIKGKVVFIGSTSLDLPDHFVGLTGSKIPGVFVHASMFASLLNKDIDEKAGMAITLLCGLLLAVLSTLVVYRLNSLVGQLSGALMLSVGTLLLVDSAFEHHFILPAPFYFATIVFFTSYTILYRFIKERSQNEYIKTLFSKYVNKDVLKELLASGKEVRLGGERRELSILFSDLRGFTALSESLSPEELTSLLNAYLTKMSAVILHNNGTIDKYIGDAIMAFWNAPLTLVTHEHNAILTALQMQDALNAFNTEHKTSLKMGIGIHTGNVVVGNVGSLERLSYTALGDVVNNTARIESLTKKYGVKILTTEEVKNMILDTTISFRKLDVITVQGKSIPTTLYEVSWMHESSHEDTSLHEQAFNHYSKGDFDHAKEIFITLKHKGNAPAELFIKRIEILEQSKPEYWNGVWSFDEK